MNNRVGTICYATEQGLGRLAKDFFDHGVVHEALVVRHPSGSRPTMRGWYPPGTPVLNWADLARSPEVRRFLDRVDVLLCFETPFDWSIPAEARRLGKKTVLMPMYEWFPEDPPFTFDLYLCPTELDHRVVTKIVFDKGDRGTTLHQLNVPAPDCTWTERRVARNFLHNAGHGGVRGRNGTLELLRAVRFLKSEAHVTIRAQNAGWLKAMTDRLEGTVVTDRVTIVGRETEYGSLFGPRYDVYVAPEKFNGLSLPLQEAAAHGLCVLTTDRVPANSWLPTTPLVAPTRYNRVRVAPGMPEIDEAVVRPEDLAAKIDALYGTDVSAYSEAGRDWAAANSWAVLGPKYKTLLDSL